MLAKAVQKEQSAMGLEMEVVTARKATLMETGKKATAERVHGTLTGRAITAADPCGGNR